jgi:hypothetical protein
MCVSVTCTCLSSLSFSLTHTHINIHIHTHTHIHSLTQGKIDSVPLKDVSLDSSAMLMMDCYNQVGARVC